MRKGLLYFFMFIGVVLLLCFINQLLHVSGQTMYGTSLPPSSPDPSGSPIPTLLVPRSLVGSSNPSGSVAMQASNSPSEEAMRGMIIRNANISLQVNDITRVMEQITQLTDKSGGYVVSSNLNQDYNGGGGYSSANINIRIPAAGLNSAITQLKSYATQVVQESITGEDVTQQYVNLESQLKNLQTAKDQLTKIMAGAKKTSDVLSVYRQLSETQGQIDVIEGQIKYYKQSVAYSLININLTVNPMIEAQQEKQWNITEVIINSSHELVDQLRSLTYGFIQFIIYYLPLILLWSCFCLIAFWVWKKIYLYFKG